MPLSVRRQKLLFSRTSDSAENGSLQEEPRRPLFVVHKHDATRLHYDFRLEHRGVLKSWAVPRGPCLDPTQSRLAVLVNDHALGCCLSEGTIPPGRYGAGTILLWDGGTWLTDQDVDQALRTGRLTFQLRGRKLNGSWSLIRTRHWPGAKRENWLLVKEDDPEAKRLSEVDILAEQPRSVLSGKTLAEIAREASRFRPKKPPPNQQFLFPYGPER